MLKSCAPSSPTDDCAKPSPFKSVIVLPRLLEAVGSAVADLSVMPPKCTSCPVGLGPSALTGHTDFGNRVIVTEVGLWPGHSPPPAAPSVSTVGTAA